MRAAPTHLTSLLGLLWLVGCLPDETPKGLRATPPGRGPTVVFNLDARPLPDIPFPNDLLARPDGAALTGLRLNLSKQGPTALERRLRTEGLALDGFSGFAPITVRFDAPLDLARLDGRGRAPDEDPVLVVCVAPQCVGERIPLDLGRGRYPTRRVVPGADALGDPRADAAEVLFETVDEDLDGDGVLDPGEDQDGDGVLDRPNVGPDGRPMSWYELQTNTLILRPLRPLTPGATYAVVITDDVRGRDGQAVRSPFAWVHHIEQAGPLEALTAALAPSGRTVDEVAFAWTFTVQTAGATARSLADGLAGAGPLANLADDFPPDVTRLDRLQTAPDGSSLLPGEALAERLAALVPSPFQDTDPAALAAAQGAVSHLVAGRFLSPALLVDDDGLEEEDARYPADGDEVFRLLPEPLVGRAEVPFWCVIPTATDDHQPPFPVALLVPDHRESRLHALLWAGALAAEGLATCALDGYAQAATLDPTAAAALDALEPGGGGSPLVASLRQGRARDLDNDGTVDPDQDLLGAELAHARDHVRQSLV
ncbi:MAG: hypothetical protein KC613_06165, partial [Myxococcales bacterium]|nr:hypothetical protein [Myxococcales bacterium]